ncbi:amidohydrolase family protein [Pseudonocardia sp. KRD-184]|uniref:Amidohydrolase family protein n=1 Tax=Pseudonocardia oceani TaxID=2792013 RepID=A0ABS6UB80_9PSEU|nr:amidohydrolase family protein [Pseudonocardia oceani]MBW0088968.1 amidohydrolase family protein [Pseudonocardia oceani]MBW0094590.1 amidohydrolase family protein [Pseudonocardia oceani]MBW0107979.1 amidohydrolase family protein [Pseudonocardia oceani]MBW0119920.1 amidohydrolase family protein [Pseudonocardia oceani]MBW0129483.1 amidohydrolase family protein [Pseudonocardia oceani]
MPPSSSTPVGRGRDVLRRPGRQIEIGLAMPVDAAAAAFALVFGGVLQRHPGLRVALTHGCGAFPCVYPRLRLVGPAEEWGALVRRLDVEPPVVDPEYLRLLVHRFGPDRLLVGTDSPFMPEQFDEAAGIVDAAVRAGGVVLGGRAGAQRPGLPRSPRFRMIHSARECSGGRP